MMMMKHTGRLGGVGVDKYLFLWGLRRRSEHWLDRAWPHTSRLAWMSVLRRAVGSPGSTAHCQWLREGRRKGASAKPRACGPESGGQEH